MEDKKYTCSDMPKLYSCPFCGSENITIRYGASGYTSNVHYPNETGFVACLKCGARSLKTRYAKNAVKKWNARKESNAAAPKWIDVKKKLPKAGTFVLLQYAKNAQNPTMHARNTMAVGRYEYGMFLVEGCCVHVTHWMPLPEPPEEEA